MPKVKLLEPQENITQEITNPVNALRQAKFTKLTQTEITLLQTELKKINDKLEERKKTLAETEVNTLKKLAKKLGYNIVKTDTVE